MNKKHNLTKAQLEEIKELAKMKALKDLASHFNMSASTFRWIRKQHVDARAIMTQ